MSNELVKTKTYGPVKMGGYGKPYRPKSESSNSDKREIPATDSTQMEQAKEISKSRGMGEGAARYQYKRLQLAQSIGNAAAATGRGTKMLDSHYKNLARTFNVDTFNAMYGLQDNGDDEMKPKYEKRMPHKMKKGDVVCMSDSVIGVLQNAQIMGPNTRMVFQDRAVMADSFSNDFSIMLDGVIAATSAQGAAMFKEDIQDSRNKGIREMEDFENAKFKRQGGKVDSQVVHTELLDDFEQTSSKKVGAYTPNNMASSNPGRNPSVEFNKFAQSQVKQHKMTPGTNVRFDNPGQKTSFYGVVNQKGGVSPLQSPKGITSNRGHKSYHDKILAHPDTQHSTFKQEGHPLHDTKVSFLAKTGKTLSKEGRAGQNTAPDFHSAMKADYQKSVDHVNEHRLKPNADKEALAHHESKIANYKSFMKEHAGNGTESKTHYSPTEKSKSILPVEDKNPTAANYTKSNTLTQRTIEAHPGSSDRELPTGQGLGGWKNPTDKANTMKGVSKPGASATDRGTREIDSTIKRTETKGAGKDSVQGAMHLQKDYKQLHGSEVNINVHDKKGTFVKKFSGNAESFYHTHGEAKKYAESKGHSLDNAVITTKGNLQNKTSNKGNDEHYTKSLGPSDQTRAKHEGGSVGFKKKGQGGIYKVPEDGSGKKRKDNLSKLGPHRSHVGSQSDVSKTSGSGGLVVSGLKGIGHQDVGAIRKQGSYHTDENVSEKSRVHSGTDLGQTKRALGKVSGLDTDKEIDAKRSEEKRKKSSGDVAASIVKKSKDEVTELHEGYGANYKAFMGNYK